MSKRFQPPFKVDADFYDAKGKLLEWAEHWGDCPDAAEVRWIVEDFYGKTISTHKTKEKANEALAAAIAALCPPLDPSQIVITPALDVHTEQNRKERG